MIQNSFLAFIYWDPRPEIFFVPVFHWPVLWYGFFFAFGFAVGFLIFYSLVLRRLYREQEGFVNLGSASPNSQNLPARGAKEVSSEPLASLKKKAMFIADRIAIYVVVSTIIGARLGHFLFYEKPADYLRAPWEIFYIWKGGLASHGAAVGIVVAIFLFARRYKEILGGLKGLALLDLVCVPTAFAGACIRIGNFFNQEILGKESALPWAIIFGHPMDRSAAIPRHPVQLYEAILYLAVFFLLWNLSRQPKFLLAKGRLLGVFLICVFGGRFVMEFFKVEQSALLGASFLTMGQILSILPIILGVYLYKKN